MLNSIRLKYHRCSRFRIYFLARFNLRISYICRSAWYKSLLIAFVRRNRFVCFDRFYIYMTTIVLLTFLANQVSQISTIHLIYLTLRDVTLVCFIVSNLQWKIQFVEHDMRHEGAHGKRLPVLFWTIKNLHEKLKGS